MKTSAHQKSYVGRRAELLSRVFLEDMHPATLLETTDENCGFDYLLGLEAPDRSTRHFAVEVKATENLTRPEFAVLLPAKTIRYWRGSNLPLVFLVVDAKKNHFYFATGDALTNPKLKAQNGGNVRVVLPLQKAETAESMARALVGA